MNRIHNPNPKKSDFQAMLKGCYKNNLNPQVAHNEFKAKYGYSPPIAWASHCLFNQNRKMSGTSQLKFARYCLRNTDSADQAIAMMQIEVGIDARWDEYKLKFLTCVREWESRVSPKIESLHASKGWRYKKFDVHLPSGGTPHHEYMEDEDIYTLNDLVKAWESLSEGEQQAEQELVKETLLGKNTNPRQARQRKPKDQASYNYKYRARAERKAESKYRQQQNYQKNYSRYSHRSGKTKLNFVPSSAKFLRGKYQTIAELKTAYRKLSKKLHPDTGGNNEDFRQLLDEYEILKSQFK